MRLIPNAGREDATGATRLSSKVLLGSGCYSERQEAGIWRLAKEVRRADGIKAGLAWSCNSTDSVTSSPLELVLASCDLGSFLSVITSQLVNEALVAELAAQWTGPA